MLAIVILAIPLGWAGVLLSERRARRLEIAGRLRATEDAYRAHGRTYPDSRRLAQWNAHLRQEFEVAASRPWLPTPTAPPIPPQGFVGSAPE